MQFVKLVLYEINATRKKVETILISGIVALGGAIGILWKQILSTHARTQIKLDECEQDRWRLRDAIRELCDRIEALENKGQP